MKVTDSIETFNSLIKRRGFIWGPSPEIYGGLAGFYSYGPAGMALKNNILDLFRRECRYFGFAEVECPHIQPSIVWEASGHLERFIDPVIRCDKCKILYRADKFLQEQLPEKMIDGLSFKEMEDLIEKNNISCPKCGTPFYKIEKYNLMLKTTVGDNMTAYLRPETATTTYLLFNRLDQDARRQYPIKVYQYGKAFRNEISPRQGVLRMRAFDQFELQIFIGVQQEMEFDEYEQIKNSKLPMLDWNLQKDNKFTPKIVSLDETIEKGILKKPAYAYCLYIAYYLTKSLGILDEVIRFRQHSIYERAHYADDAWDLEINTNQFGWVEICGIHDRTNYDLKRHAEYSKVNLEVSTGKDPRVKEVPQVLEIAFGIDRIIYCLLENAFSVEKDRIILKLNPELASNTVSIFPLVSNKEELTDLALKVHKDLIENRIGSFYDASGSIGKRYRRQDELGTPYCVTIDYESLDDNSVTIRDRDTMDQIRIKIPNLVETIKMRLKK